jgi:hypothetical protein
MDTDRRGTGEKADVTARPIPTPHHQPKPWHSQTSGLAPRGGRGRDGGPLDRLAEQILSLQAPVAADHWTAVEIHPRIQII